MFKPRNESELFFRKIRRSLVLFSALLIVGFCVIILRLWHLQVIQHETLANRAENNRAREVILD
ncbi:MAG: hypothetical protein HQK87_06440, partial [Nitrospinae bacterium]|nr:hypothetical protein [Nitrospinota bacterium]